MITARDRRNTKRAWLRGEAWLALLLALWIPAVPGQAAHGAARPLRLIVPFPPGGGLDLTARLLTPHVSETLAKPIVVDNRGGGGGLIGLDIASRATADGHVFVMCSASHVIQTLAMKTSFDLFRDFTPVSEVIASPYALVVNNNFPAKSVAELIQQAKAKPGGIIYASAGNATLQHVATEMFGQAAGFKALHVPYKGVGPVLPDLFAGRVHFFMSSLSALSPHIRSRAVTPLAVTSAERSPVFPSLPTLIEAGVPGYVVVQWQAVLAPAGTPAAPIERFQQAIAGALRQPEVARSLSADGSTIVGSTPSAFKVMLEAERAKWSHVLERAGLRAL